MPQPFNEKEFVINAFNALLARVGGARLAIYGIGNNTRIVLENCPADHVVGIMDELHTGEVIHGKKVISIQEMIELGVQAVVIIARASNLKIIYRRIAAACAENGIAVYDINGQLVSDESEKAKAFDKYRAIHQEALKAKIDAAQVVSFDVFDTLVMRRVLYPNDIFLLMENTLGADFAKRRISADTELIKAGQHPTLDDIYAHMGAFSPQLEIEYEKKYLIRRDAVCEMLEYAARAGKTVYALSDMYLPAPVLFELLSALDINIPQSHILVSCDHQSSKWTGGLFQVLRDKVGPQKILHIGDNYECDIRNAQENGIDDTFHIESALQMLEDSYAEGLLQHENTLTNRLLIADFIGRQLNSPFLFSRTQGKFEITSNYEMAHAFIAPMLYLFFAWLVHTANGLGFEQILLPSRDGYVIERLYNSLRPGGVPMPQMRYFYVSRAAAISAGTSDDEDMIQVARLEYAGRPQDMLKTRFHLEDGEIMAPGEEDLEAYVLAHRRAILEKAERARQNYLKYIDTLHIAPRSTVGYMDFIAAGNCQRFLTGMLDFNLHGLYFASFNIDRGDAKRQRMAVECMMEIDNCFQFSNHIFEMQFMLEPILTSFEPTLSHFDDDGQPVFFKEDRSQKQLDDLAQILDGIVDYAKQTLIGLDAISRDSLPVVDRLISLLKPTYSVIKTDYFDNIEMKDPFNNRVFSFQLD